MRSVIIILFSVALSAQAQSVSTAPGPGRDLISPEPLPTIKQLTLTDLETYIGQCDHPLIINFWATFCTPCLKEIPYFQNTVAKYKDQGVELLLVSLDLPDYYPTRIAAFAGKNHYTASLAWLDRRDAGYFYPRIDKRWTGGMPSSLFINNKTNYRLFFDRQLTERQVEPAIKTMLADSLIH